jgi:dihydroflavonol-4-reductase
VVDAVTGATGFTGGALARRLIASGSKVRALVRPGSDHGWLERLGAELVLGDIGDVEAQKALCAGADRVFHIAALYREAKYPDAEYFRVNRDATRTLLEAAAGAGAQRFVHCSTVGVHGDVTDPPADEASPIAPGDVYQRSKVEGERIALEFAAKGGAMEVVVIRPAGIYGPGDTRFLKLFRMVGRGRFFFLGDGRTLFHAVYIDDLVQGFLLAGERSGLNGEVFIIAGDRYVTLNELVAAVADALGVPNRFPHLPMTPVRWLAAVVEAVCVPLHISPPLHRRRVDFFVKNRAFSIEAAEKRLGYQPAVTLEEGVRRTAAWYREQGLL